MTKKKEEEEARLLCEKPHGLQHLALLTHLWMICATSLLGPPCPTSWALSPTCPERGEGPRAACLSCYLWSSAWCGRRSPTCVPSACPESRMGRGAWWPCWGTSSPCRAQTCQVTHSQVSMHWIYLFCFFFSKIINFIISASVYCFASCFQCFKVS